MEKYRVENNILVQEKSKKKFFGGVKVQTISTSFEDISDISKLINVSDGKTADVCITLTNGSEISINDDESANGDVNSIYDQIVDYLKSRSISFTEKVRKEDLWS